MNYSSINLSNMGQHSHKEVDGMDDGQIKCTTAAIETQDVCG